MRRLVIITFSLIFLLLNIKTNAQNLQYGISGGLLLSHPQGYKNRVGFNIGVKGEYAFGKNQNYLYITPSILLVNKGWKDEVVYLRDETTHEWTCSVYYAEIPIEVGYNFALSDDVHLFLEVGPYFAYGLFGKSKLHVYDELYDRDNVFSDEVYKRFDMGAKFQVGVDFPKWQTQVSLGWSRSFTKPTTGNWENLDPKDSSFFFQLTYFFI